jgi:hypothetical protein
MKPSSADWSWKPPKPVKAQLRRGDKFTHWKAVKKRNEDLSQMQALRSDDLLLSGSDPRGVARDIAHNVGDRQPHWRACRENMKAKQAQRWSGSSVPTAAQSSAKPEDR